MNNQNNKNSRHSMLGMIILCIVPLAIIFLVGKNIFSAGYLWPIVIGAFAILHIVLMFRGHGAQDSVENEEKGSTTPASVPEKNETEKSRSCCAPALTPEKAEPKKGRSCCG